MGAARECRRFKAPESCDKDELVIVLHGLFMHGLFMFPLGRRLAKGGYEAIVYDYPTRKEGIDGHAEIFKEFMENVCGGTHKRINIVTHSLGGIVARVALAKALSSESSPLHGRIGRVVMLAPPNKGSDVAKAISQALPFAGMIAKPLPELSSAEDSPIHSMPVPEGVDIGIVAGRDDFEVAIGYTHLPCESSHLVIDSDHTLMPFRRDVAKLVLTYIESGSF